MEHYQKYSSSFLFLQQEGHLIHSCLTAGLTQLRSANVGNKGAFYAASFNLSVGMERLLKSIFIIDHMLEHNLTSPDDTQLRKHGHNLVGLYDLAVSSAQKHNVLLPSRCSLDNTNQEILRLLGDFAKSTRYYNLDVLTKPSACAKNKDPLTHWNDIIKATLEQNVRGKYKTKISDSAHKIAPIIISLGCHNLDQTPVSSEDIVALPALHDRAMKYVVLRIVMILLPIRDLISALSLKACAYPEPPFPQMDEFLEWLLDDRQYVLSKKRWP